MWNKQFIGCKESCLDGVITLLPRLEMSMKKSIRKVFMTLLVLSFAIPSVAQGNSETGLWTSIEAEKKLDERFSVVGEANCGFATICVRPTDGLLPEGWNTSCRNG